MTTHIILSIDNSNYDNSIGKAAILNQAVLFETPYTKIPKLHHMMNQSIHWMGFPGIAENTYTYFKKINKEKKNIYI